MPTIDARKLGSLAETISLLANDAAHDSEVARQRGDHNAALIAIGKCRGLQEAANLLIDVTRKEIAL